MKTFILLLAGFLCLIQTAGAQNHPANDLVFSTADTSDGYLKPRRMVQTSDGGFLVAGKFFDQGYITKIQSCGTQVWMRTYAFGDETELLSLVELPSGEIAAVGSCDNCAPNDSTLKALVIKTDQNGLLLADTTLGNLNLSALATDILLNEDQQLAVSGYLTIGPGFLPSNAFMAIMAPESLQTPDWNTYHQLFYDYSNAITQTHEGNYVLAGRSSPALFAPVQAQVYCTDAAGNLLWSHASPYQNSQFNDVTQAADGRIVALGDRLVDANVGRELFMLVQEKETGAVLQEITLGSADDDAGKSIQSVENGFLIGAIYGMPRQQDWNRRDWVLRLDTQFNMVDQYFRDDYLLAHSMVNALPLSPDGRWFAYYAQVSFFTANQILFYKHTDQGYRTLLENAPSNHQLTPRNLQTNKGDIRIKGAVAPDQYDALRLDIFRNHQLFQTFLDDTPQNFDFQQQMEAELAEYTYRLTGVKGSINTLELEACDLVAGDVYLIEGQSNAVAGLPLQDADHAYRHHTSPYIRNFGLKFKNDTLFTWKKEESGWLDFNDNIVGQWGILMAKNIVDQHQIPVAVINGAVSGIAIDSLSPPNSRYQKFVHRVERAGVRDHLRGILWFQGETNAGAAFYDSALDYYQKFELLDDAWKEDFPSIEKRYLFQIRPGAYWIGATLLTCLQIEEAHRQIAENLPGWQIMSSTGMNHDSTHYFYTNGYERAGQDIYRLVNRDLYGAPATPNIHPPTPETLRFSHCNRKEITLTLRHVDDTYIWTPGWESDFQFAGSAQTSVTGGSITGNQVKLTLNAAPGPGFSGLRYTSHPGGSEAPVKNANGIGMLTFLNLPVLPYEPDTTRFLTVTCDSSQAGVFVQVLTNQIGCDSTVITEAIFVPLLLENVAITPDTGMNSGVATISVQGGHPPYSYLWSNGDTGQTADSLAVGAYTVTVTDAIGCTAEWTILMTVSATNPGEMPDYTLLPNPCGAFTVLRKPANEPWNGMHVRVTNLSGQILLRQDLTSARDCRITTEQLPAGMYQVWVLRNGAFVWRGKLMKG